MGCHGFVLFLFSVSLINFTLIDPKVLLHANVFLCIIGYLLKGSESKGQIEIHYHHLFPFPLQHYVCVCVREREREREREF